MGIKTVIIIALKNIRVKTVGKGSTVGHFTLATEEIKYDWMKCFALQINLFLNYI